MKKLFIGLRGLLFALGMTIAAASGPASAATITTTWGAGPVYLHAAQYGGSWYQVGTSSATVSHPDLVGVLTVYNGQDEIGGYWSAPKAEGYLTVTDGAYSATWKYTYATTCTPNCGSAILPDATDDIFTLTPWDGDVERFTAGWSVQSIAEGATVEMLIFRNAECVEAPEVSAVPVPAALPLMAGALGLAGLIGFKRRRK